jgi:hypothetical protein
VSSWSDRDIKKIQLTASELEASDYRTAVLAPTPEIATRFEEYVKTTYDTQTLAADATRHLTPTEIEKRFGISSMRRLCHTEQTYFNLKYEDTLQRAIQIATGIDHLFSNHSVSYAYQYRGGELFRLLVHFALEEHGRYNVWDAFSPFNNTVMFSTHLTNQWDTYTTVSYEDIEQNARKQTKDYITEFTAEKKRFSHGESITNHSNIFLKKLLNQMDNLRSLIKNEYPRDLSKKLWAVSAQEINEIINRQKARSISASQALCAESNYIFFPLQLPAESRLTVFSPEYYNQKWIVEYLSRSIPYGMKVLVKQHPNHIGQQSPRWIQNLSNIDNIEFVHPELNAHYAIKHADSVVVTNNTVGFETLFYETPLVVLGQAFYRETPAVYPVETLSSLDEIIANAVGTAIDERKRIASIHSLRSAVYDVSGTVGSQDRAEDRVGGLLKFISSIDSSDII